MDFRPKSPARVAFSFAAGTFDLRAWCPGLCYEGDHGRSTAVWLDDRWDCLLDAVRELGLILSSIRSGPLSIATAWEQADFQQIPGTHELVEWHTGTELRRDRISAVNAVVEEHGDQQIASLQFFDRQGIGCLKLMLTNASQVDRFKDLLLSHATLKPWGPGFLSPSAAVAQTTQQTCLKQLQYEVEPLWQSLNRTQPGDNFPGLAKTSRCDAVRSMEGILSWRLNPTMIQQVLEWATEKETVIHTTIRNPSVYSSAECRFVKSQRCGCGSTFFGLHAQMTLRPGCSEVEVWALSYPTRNNVFDQRIEIYDTQQRFISQLALPLELHSPNLSSWQNLLGQGRLC